MPCSTRASTSSFNECEIAQNSEPTVKITIAVK